MVVSEKETAAFDNNHTQKLATSSPSLPLPQLQQELPLRESPNSPPSNRQNSTISLSFDEFHSKNGRTFGSLNMDEFLANIWNSDDNQVDSPPPPPPPPPPLPTHDELTVRDKKIGEETEPIISQQASFSDPPPICKKTVDEVWYEMHKEDHQPQKNEEANGEISGNESLKRQQTLGEMTLEDFLIKAGVVQESSLPSLSMKSSSPQRRSPSSTLPIQSQTGSIANIRPYDASYKMGHAMRVGSSTQQNVGGCVSGNGVATCQVFSQTHSLAVKEPTTSSAVEKCQNLAESSGNSGKKRIIDGPPEVLVERRQRRMLKNRESAARSRARRQAYTVELEAGLNQLRQENEKLKEILAEAEQKRKQEVGQRKHSTNAQKRAEKFRAIRRTVSVAW